MSAISKEALHASDPELNAAWKTEVDRRVEEIQAGKVGSQNWQLADDSTVCWRKNDPQDNLCDADQTALPKMPRDCPQMCVLGDARRDEIYFALYDHTGRRVKDCRIATLEALADEIHQPIWFVSSEIERYKSDLASLFGGFASIAEAPVFPGAATVGSLAFHRFRDDGNRGDENPEPIYLRAPQYRKIGT